MALTSDLSSLTSFAPGQSSGLSAHHSIGRISDPQPVAALDAAGSSSVSARRALTSPALMIEIGSTTDRVTVSVDFNLDFGN